MRCILTKEALRSTAYSTDQAQRTRRPAGLMCPPSAQLSAQASTGALLPDIGANQHKPARAPCLPAAKLTGWHKSPALLCCTYSCTRRARAQPSARLCAAPAPHSPSFSHQSAVATVLSCAASPSFPGTAPTAKRLRPSLPARRYGAVFHQFVWRGGYKWCSYYQSNTCIQQSSTHSSDAHRCKPAHLEPHAGDITDCMPSPAETSNQYLILRNSSPTQLSNKACDREPFCYCGATCVPATLHSLSRRAGQPAAAGAKPCR